MGTARVKDHLTCLAAAERWASGKREISSLPGSKPTALAIAAFMGLSLPAEAQVYWQGPDDYYASRHVSRRIERKRPHVARVKHPP